MTDYPRFVKEKLAEIISKMVAEPKPFVKNPNIDFTRNRKLSFETVMSLMLSMGGNSLINELMEYFHYDVDMASSSAVKVEIITARNLLFYPSMMNI